MIGQASYKAIGEITGQSPMTVARYDHTRVGFDELVKIRNL